MSANNWRQCPKCLRDKEAADTAAMEKVKASYGSVGADEYLASLDTAKAQAAIQIEEEFREDYEIWTDTSGKFYVGYRGECQGCGFRVKFKHEFQALHAPDTRSNERGHCT